MFFLSIAMTHTQNDSADVMRKLRLSALTKKASEYGIPPSLDNGAVYCVVVEFGPLTTRSFRSFRYLTVTRKASTQRSTFGIIGGFAHERIPERQLSDLWKLAMRYADKPRLPPTIRTRNPTRYDLYMVTYGGVRVIEADRASVEGGSDKASELFARAQDVYYRTTPHASPARPQTTSRIGWIERSEPLVDPASNTWSTTSCAERF